tara:strand:- start:761 stop:910 length:150 start_codon:yes stop_codon:yes gene_type:complete
MKEVTIYTDIGRVPIPKGYTKKRVVEILEKTGHKVLSVSDASQGKKKAV